MFLRVSESHMVKPAKDYNHYIMRNLFFLLIMRSEDSLEYIFVCSAVFSVALLSPLISWHQHHLFPSMTCITWHMKSYTVNNRVLSLHERGNHFHFFPGRNNFYFHFLYYCVRQRQQHQYWWVLNLDPGQTNHKYKKQHFFSNLPTLFQALSFVHPLKSFMLRHSSQQGGEQNWSNTRAPFEPWATLNVVCH